MLLIKWKGFRLARQSGSDTIGWRRGRPPKHRHWRCGHSITRPGTCLLLLKAENLHVTCHNRWKAAKIGQHSKTYPKPSTFLRILSLTLSATCRGIMEWSSRYAYHQHEVPTINKNRPLWKHIYNLFIIIKILVHNLKDKIKFWLGIFSDVSKTFVQNFAVPGIQFTRERSKSEKISLEPILELLMFNLLRFVPFLWMTADGEDWKDDLNI